MAEESISLRDLIKHEVAYDPFSDFFEKERILKEFYESKSDEDSNILQFLLLCNNFHEDIKQIVFGVFDDLLLSDSALIDFLFASINKQFLEAVGVLFKSINVGSVYEPEKSSFLTSTVEEGKQVNVKLALEVGGDILSILMNFSHQWSLQRNADIIEKKDRKETKENLFFKLWLYSNVYLGIRNLAFDVVKYEDGKVNIRDENKIKIENGKMGVYFIRTAGVIRSNNNVQELLMTRKDLFPKQDERIGVVDFKVESNVVSPQKGRINFKRDNTSIANLFVFYPHFLAEKLEYFDGLTLKDLVDIVLHIEECVEKIQEKSRDGFVEKNLERIPIKFNTNSLIEFLSGVSGHKKGTVSKVLSALTATTTKPYFWREPFIKKEEYLYFPAAALVSPNYCLYFDRWTEVSGFSLEIKEKKFRDFVITEIDKLKEEINYEFHIRDFRKLNIPSELVANNILIETKSLFILLEVKSFNFPIESEETDSCISMLGGATFDISEKAEIISKATENEKEMVKLILTNYTHFTGLQINDVPIIDFTLFKNYVSVGNIRRVAVRIDEEESIENDFKTLHYYKNEIEFNSNLKRFFQTPIPIENILQRLHAKEQTITPEKIRPSISIDIVDHRSDDEVMDMKLNDLGNLLNYKYFVDPSDENVIDSLDESILFSLSEVFNRMAFSEYESYDNRVNLYHKVSKTNIEGFAHLSFYILSKVESIDLTKIKKDQKSFKGVKYESGQVIKMLKRKKAIVPGLIRLSEFEIKEGHFSKIEEKQIISFAIDLISGLSPSNFKDEILESLFLPLALIHGFRKKYDVEKEFYSACSNIVDGLNYIHKYQSARDFSEEILILSIKDNNHCYGWNLLYKCYTTQKSLFDASINGCLFLTSIIKYSEIPEFIMVDVFNITLRFFRNFGYFEFARRLYKNLENVKFSEYDDQKIALTYFNTFLKGAVQKNENALNEVFGYLEKKSALIIQYGDYGVAPWLAFLYNVKKVMNVGQLDLEKRIDTYIDIFEKEISKENLDAIKNKIHGDLKNPKEAFVSAMLNVLETRSVRDYIYESQDLSILADNLIRSSIEKNDIDGILLAGFVLNDQSLTYKNKFLENKDIVPMFANSNKERLSLLRNYRAHILSQIKIKDSQLLVWLFESRGRVFWLSIDSKGEFKYDRIEQWRLSKMLNWGSGIGDFYFNSKKDRYNNFRKEYHYSYEIQNEDYEILKEEFEYASLPIPPQIEELLTCFSIDLTTFPHNLLQTNGNFISKNIPICNVVSIERFLNKGSTLYIEREYNISAWIPSDDQEPIISWGYNLLLPILEKIGAKIYTSTYPSQRINSELNVFLAHGVVDGSGFKAVYTNHEEKKGIVYPHEVFGMGKIAILFICNSGSSKDAVFSNSTVSFSNELLRMGYEAVISPFWPFDVTMSKTWLSEFLSSFNQGYSINESVWIANTKLTQYNEETSEMFYAPAGCLAMHLYGNPNIFVNQSS